MNVCLASVRDAWGAHQSLLVQQIAPQASHTLARSSVRVCMHLITVRTTNLGREWVCQGPIFWTSRD